MSSQTLVAPKYELTAADKKLILEVAEETAKSGSPIALVRGPETKDLLAKFFDTKGWEREQALGTLVQRGNPSEVRGQSRPSVRVLKRVETILVGSKKWPQGVPVGVYDISTQDQMERDKYTLTSSNNDISWDEERRLGFLAAGKKFLTDAQIREDAARKESLRSARIETEATTTVEERMANSIAAAFARLGGASTTGTEKK